jgi:hypothetical protein
MYPLRTHHVLPGNEEHVAFPPGVNFDVAIELLLGLRHVLKRLPTADGETRQGSLGSHAPFSTSLYSQMMNSGLCK